MTTRSPTAACSMEPASQPPPSATVQDVTHTARMADLQEPVARRQWRAGRRQLHGGQGPLDRAGIKIEPCLQHLLPALARAEGLVELQGLQGGPRIPAVGLEVPRLSRSAAVRYNTSRWPRAARYSRSRCS